MYTNNLNIKDTFELFVMTSEYYTIYDHYVIVYNKTCKGSQFS